MDSPEQTGRKKNSSRVMAGTALAAWMIIMTLVCTVMMARHSIPLPAQAAEDYEVAAALATLRLDETQRDHWMMVHVFYTSCPCSRRLAAYLLERPRPAQLVEHVLLVGDDEAWRLQATRRGYHVHVIEAETLTRRYHLQAAPLFAVLDPLDRLGYLGGYTQRKQGLDVQDLDVLARVQDERGVKSLPLFGCAVSRELRHIVDPTGWL